MEKLKDFVNRLVEPSPLITQRDRRSQASLLAGFLLGIMVVAPLVELITVFTTDQDDYQGYWTTMIVIVLLVGIYRISRTERVQLAAVLTVGVTTLGAWISGLFDLLFIPLWLGSLYMSMQALIILMVVDMAVMLTLPFFIPDLTFDYVLGGPFSFFLFTSFILLVTTHYRNVIEDHRRSQLADQERASRREAARSASLLRVAERLNAQMDRTTLLRAICEELSRALDVPVVSVSLYDAQQLVFRPAYALGITDEQFKSLKPLSHSLYHEIIAPVGATFAWEDVREHPQLPNSEMLRTGDLRSMAFTTMKHDQQIIGYLAAFTRGETRTFSDEELLLMQGIADQAALAIINTRLFKEAQRRLERLQALRDIDSAIMSPHGLTHTLDVVLEQVCTQLRVDAAAILLLEKDRQYLMHAASRGFQSAGVRSTRLRLGEGMAGQVARHGRIMKVTDLRTNPQTMSQAPALLREGFITYVAAPLVSQESLSGVLEVFHRAEFEPDEEWMGFFEALAGQAAIAIQDATLVENLRRSNLELTEAYASTIEGWSHALDLRDHETEGHTRRVTELSLELARAFGFSESELMHIRHGALLHDIGKMGVPDRILLKPGPLTEEEWELMRMHPRLAYELLLPIPYLRPALDIPYYHHERWDGTGYPHKLKEQNIPITARIFAVVDVWDALTNDRPYRAGWPKEKVLEHIRKGAGSHFDPYVVEVFEDIMKKREKALSNAATTVDTR